MGHGLLEIPGTEAEKISTHLFRKGNEAVPKSWTRLSTAGT